MRISDWSSDVCSSDLDQIEAVVGKGIQCTDIGACKAQHRLRAIAAARMRYRALSNIHSEHRMRAGTGQQRTAEALAAGGVEHAPTVRQRCGKSIEMRSEERRVGQEGGRTGRSRWCALHKT